jgi:hypothetical protein
MSTFSGQHPKMTAAEVLDRHRKLTEQMRDKTVINYIDDVIEDVADKAAKDGGIWQAQRTLGSMVHPALSLAEFRRMLESDLRDAQTFQVTAEMVDVVSAVYEKSRESVITVEADELPAPAGFIWLDKAMLTPDKHDIPVSNRAISWGPTTVSFSNSLVKPGIRVTTWFSTHDRDGIWTDEIEADWAGVHPDLDVLYAHSTVMAFGERIGTAKPDSPMDRYDFMMWLHTLWAFMDTDIVTTAKEAIPRPFARRAQRVLKRPDVSVVYLRRVSTITNPNDEHEHREVDWSSRWVVQGHYRHIEDYDGLKHHASLDHDHVSRQCAACGSRITWVHAYVKGPEGKPLVTTGDKVFKLSR